MPSAMNLKRFTLALLVCFCSCTGLKKSQIQVAENFATATKGISKVPPDIYYRIYQLKSESQTLQLNSLLATNDVPKESIQLLKNDYEEKIKFIEIAESYSTSYQIVEKYASLVLCLLSETYLKEFNKSKATWQCTFEGLIKKYNSVAITKIPPSVGNLTATIIQELGQARIARLQKKYLKEAIHTARRPFENICDDFILLDSLKIKSELSNLPDFLDNNYADFLQNIRAYEKQGNNPYYYYKEYTPIYSNWLLQINELNILSANTIKAFRSLKNAYGQLEDYVTASTTGAVPDGIKTLMADYAVLIETYGKFQYQKEKLNMAVLLK
jgi:hypothetical protein